MSEFEFLKQLSYITTQVKLLNIQIKNGDKQPYITSTIKYLKDLLNEVI